MKAIYRHDINGFVTAIYGYLKNCVEKQCNGCIIKKLLFEDVEKLGWVKQSDRQSL